MENIIIDTDLGFDCDDGGALLIANKFHNKKLFNLLAVTHCVDKLCGANAIKFINEYYGNPQILVGLSDNYAFDVDNLYEEFFAKLKYREDFCGFTEKPSFYKLIDGAFDKGVLEKDNTYKSSSGLIKDVLMTAEDNSITLVCIGQLNTLAKLVCEDYSLLSRKLKKAVVMCGNFKQDGEYYDDGETLWHGEFNVIMDVNSAKKVVNDVDLPIDFVDYNQGDDVLTGKTLNEDENSPVFSMYKIHGKGGECSSWDIVALLWASDCYNDLFEVSNYGKAKVVGRGKTEFYLENGRHRLVTIKKDSKIQLKNLINNIFSKGY